MTMLIKKVTFINTVQLAYKYTRTNLITYHISVVTSVQVFRCAALSVAARLQNQKKITKIKNKKKKEKETYYKYICHST